MRRRSDALRPIQLFMRCIADAVLDGRHICESPTEAADEGPERQFAFDLEDRTDGAVLRNHPHVSRAGLEKVMLDIFYRFSREG
jgi:hypothetical protein